MPKALILDGNRIERMYGEIEFVISEEAMDLTRILGGVCQFVDSHIEMRDCGIVERAWIQDGDEGPEVWAEWSWIENDADTDVIRNKVDQKRRNGISPRLGLQDYEWVYREDDDEEFLRVLEWGILEVSSEPIPANPRARVMELSSESDTSVASDSNQVRLNDFADYVTLGSVMLDGEKRLWERLNATRPSIRLKASSPVEELSSQVVDDVEEVVEMTTEAVSTVDRQEVADIVALGARYNQSELAAEYIRDGRSLADFQSELLSDRANVDGRFAPSSQVTQASDSGDTSDPIPSATGLKSEIVLNSNRDYASNFLKLKSRALEQARDGKSFQASRLLGAMAFGGEFNELAALEGWSEGVEFGHKGDRVTFSSELLRPQTAEEAFVIAGTNVSGIAGTTADFARYAGSLLDTAARGIQELVTIVTGVPAGNYQIPEVTNNVSAAFGAADRTLTDTDPTFGNISFTPQEMAITTATALRTRTLVGDFADMVVMSELNKARTRLLTATSVEGSGTGNVPSGMWTNLQTGYSSDYGADVNALTYSNIVAAVTKVDEEGVDENGSAGGARAWIIASECMPHVRTLAKTTGSETVVAGDTAYTMFRSNEILRRDGELREWSLDNERAFQTSYFTSNKGRLLYADLSEYFWVFWDEITFILDEITKPGRIRYTTVQDVALNNRRNKRQYGLYHTA